MLNAWAVKGLAQRHIPIHHISLHSTSLRVIHFGYYWRRGYWWKPWYARVQVGLLRYMCRTGTFQDNIVFICHLSDGDNKQDYIIKTLYLLTGGIQLVSCNEGYHCIPSITRTKITYTMHSTCCITKGFSPPPGGQYDSEHLLYH